jgi:hypothetical protein
MWKHLQVKYPLFLSYFNEIEFSWQIFGGGGGGTRNNLMEIRPVGVELFHADRLTDGWMDKRTNSHDEANSRFSQICERV